MGHELLSCICCWDFLGSCKVMIVHYIWRRDNNFQNIESCTNSCSGGTWYLHLQLD